MIRRILTRIVPYLLATSVCLFFLWSVYDLRQADFRVPFLYGSDALFYAMVIKGTMDNGWYLHNQHLGMPFGMDLHDFPFSDSLHILVMKVILLLTGAWATAMNIYHILTFPLATASAMLVLRHFGVSWLIAAVMGLLFAFLPYHFHRGQGHLFLSAYYLVPLMVMVAVWVYCEENLFGTGSAAPRSRGGVSISRKLIAAFIICLLVGSAGVYYAFFGCFFLLVAGASASFARKTIRPLIVSVALVSMVTCAVMINLSPSILYNLKHGANAEAAGRSPLESEVYGLKIVQLLLPANHHRISKVAALKDLYNQSTPLVNENQSVSLGLVGSMGFLLLIGCIFACRKGTSESELASRIGVLSLLNLSGVLLATIGGFSAVFAILVSPQIRGYNRICVYIAFFSFFLLGLLLEQGRRRFATTAPRKALFALFAGLLLVIGLFDQTTKAFVPRYEMLQAEFYNDERFVRRIETAMPPDTMILQMPYDAFLPMAYPTHKMLHYDHFRPYLHSRNLKWSYGAMRGRTPDLWQSYVMGRPVEELLETVSLAGFKGVYVDRYGYKDNAADLETGLRRMLGSEPIISENNRFAFFSMTEFSERVKANRDRSGLFGPSGIKRLVQVRLGETTEKPVYSLGVFKDRGDYVNVNGWAFINGKSSVNSSIQLVLKSENSTYLLATHPMKRPDVTMRFRLQNYDDSGFSCIIAKEALEPGRYAVGILVAADGAKALQFTDRVITVVK